MSADSDYKNNQQVANKRWHIKNPDYWRNYRASHPDYVQSNRDAQRVRDKTTDNNIPHHDMDDVAGGGNASHLAKSDALPVKITLITKGYDEGRDLAKSLLYSRNG